MTVTPDSDAAPWEGTPRDPQLSYPAGPPVPSPVPPRGRSRRLLAALGGGLVLLVAVAVVLVLANPPAPAGQASRLSSYVPANAVGYVELRLDLPGNQRANVTGLLGAFPGLDEAGLEEKLNDLLAELGERGIDWTTDVEPWFDGESVLVFNEIAGTSRDPRDAAYSGIVAIKDRAALRAVIDRHGLPDGLQSLADYRGASVWTGEMSGEAINVALTNDAVLFTTRLADLHQAIDVNAGDQASLADLPAFKGAIALLPSDRLGLAYFNVEALTDYLLSAIDDADVPFPNWRSQLEQAPGIVVGELRAEANHIILETHSLPRQGGSLPPSAPSRSTDLASMFPANTLAYAEVREVGAGIKEAYRQLSQFSDEMEELDLPIELEQLLGARPEDFLDFLGDTAIGFSGDGERFGGGLVGQLNDEAAARERIERVVASLRALLAFGGGDVPVTIADERHGTVNVTVFRFREIPGMDMPFESFSYAIAEGRLVMGFDDFVIEALDGGPEVSLAEAAGYSRALTAAGGAQNSGHLFFDVGGIRGLVERTLRPGQAVGYEEAKPYLEPIHELMLTYSAAGDAQVQRIVLFIERP